MEFVTRSFHGGQARLWASSLNFSPLLLHSAQYYVLYVLLGPHIYPLLFNFKAGSWGLTPTTSYSNHSIHTLSGLPTESLSLQSSENDFARTWRRSSFLGSKPSNGFRAESKLKWCSYITSFTSKPSSPTFPHSGAFSSSKRPNPFSIQGLQNVVFSLSGILPSSPPLLWLLLLIHSISG